MYGKIRNTEMSLTKTFMKKTKCSGRSSGIFRKITILKIYTEGGITGEYGRYIAEILLPHSVTNDITIGNDTELRLKIYIYI